MSAFSKRETRPVVIGLKNRVNNDQHEEIG